MRPKPIRTRVVETLIWAASVLLLAPGVFAANEPQARETRPAYARSQAQRPSDPAKAHRPAMPEPLRRKAVSDPAPDAKARVPGSPGAAATRPPRGPRPGLDRVEDRLAQQARDAAAWAAERQLATRGLAEYYRAGFFLGQRDALADPRLGAWDFREGRRFALSDPESRRAGLEQGQAQADQLAWSQAEERVRSQFMDLRVEPRFDGGRFLESGVAVPTRVARPHTLSAPTLTEVFETFPLSGFAFDSGLPGYVAGFPIDVVRLSGCAAYTDFFDRGWDDPQAAFQAFLDHPARSRFFRRLADPDDRRRFRAVFGVALDRELGRLGERSLSRAFDRGFDDGFDYGAFIHQELDYRRGYFEGFVTALERGAEEGFRRTFPRSYENAYARLFGEWSDNPKPALGQVRLVDADDDGIFEPGERVIVETELINYGGRPGRFPIQVEGDVLASGGATERSRLLPARSVEWDRRLTAKIQDTTPNRTRTRVDVRLADQSTTLPLTVSYPLQFVPGSFFAARRNLQGEVRVEVDVENQSRLPRGGRIQLRSSSRASSHGVADAAEVTDLGPGGRTTLSLSVQGLPVLDLIAGEVTLNLEVQGNGALQDTLDYNVPEVVRDLGNDDLLEYVVQLSRDRRASPREVARARSLFMERLREDWAHAVRRSGNPYKADYRRGESNTALGELVRTVDAVGRDIGSPEVFGGLSRDVIRLAGDLPGPHPLLRKYVRRLARELP